LEIIEDDNGDGDDSGDGGEAIMMLINSQEISIISYSISLE
jgi:hypothetical protein